MSTVIDASVLVAALVDSAPAGRWAEEITGQGGLNAPELVLVEATNILRRMERAGTITPRAAGAAQAEVLQLHLELFSYYPFAGRIWLLRKSVTSYDAWYVALAEALRLPLATLDERLSRATGPRCQFLTPSAP